MAAIPQPYTSQEEGTFAYITIKERLPTILNQIITCFTNTWSESLKDVGLTSSDEAQAAQDESKEILHKLSGFRKELKHNASLVPFPATSEELKCWNDQLAQVEKAMGSKVTWFEGPWLFVECYMYRKVRWFFETSNHFQLFDPFDVQKKEALMTAFEATKAVANHLIEAHQNPNDKKDLETFLEMSLWGNKCDLSLSVGSQKPENQSKIQDLSPLRKMILQNDLPLLLDYFLSLKTKHAPVVVDIVLDNAGFELFTDLCLADVLTRILPGSAVIRFYVKTMPWFVSDAMEKDFLWLLEFLSTSKECSALRQLGQRWLSNLESKNWILIEDHFWTLGCDYSVMKKINGKLYNQLSEADIVLFKGDLNYRKLTGDLVWKRTTLFNVALRGFEPTNVCSLRTIKADVVVGLASDSIYANLPENWYSSGEYAVVHLSLI